MKVVVVVGIRGLGKAGGGGGGLVGGGGQTEADGSVNWRVRALCREEHGMGLNLVIYRVQFL